MEPTINASIGALIFVKNAAATDPWVIKTASPSLQPSVSNANKLTPLSNVTSRSAPLGSVSTCFDDHTLPVTRPRIVFILFQ